MLYGIGEKGNFYVIQSSLIMPEFDIKQKSEVLTSRTLKIQHNHASASIPMNLENGTPESSCYSVKSHKSEVE